MHRLARVLSILGLLQFVDGETLVGQVGGTHKWGGLNTPADTTNDKS